MTAGSQGRGVRFKMWGNVSSQQGWLCYNDYSQSPESSKVLLDEQPVTPWRTEGCSLSSRHPVALSCSGGMVSVCSLSSGTDLGWRVLRLEIGETEAEVLREPSHTAGGQPGPRGMYISTALSYIAVEALEGHKA